MRSAGYHPTVTRHDLHPTIDADLRAGGRPGAGRGATRGAARGAIAGLLLATTACGLVPARPDAAGWRDTAGTALDDAVALVGTASLVLQEQRRDHVLGGYGVATLVHAEESMGNAVDSVDTVQPPRSLGAEATRVGDLLAEADDAVRTAREALVSGDTAAFPRLTRYLDVLHDRLEKAGSAL
jgi:hypothetical protein